MGRKTTFSQAKADKICEAIASGLSLRKACLIKGMPKAPTVISWVLDYKHYPEFAEQYANARRSQAAKWADEIVDIADDGENDTYTEEKNGKLITKVDWDNINRSRLRVDTRKWLLSKLLPKEYGDKVDVTSGDKPLEKPQVINIIVDPKPEHGTA